MDVSFRIRDQSFQQYKQMLLAEKLTFTNQKKKKIRTQKCYSRQKSTSRNRIEILKIERTINLLGQKQNSNAKILLAAKINFQKQV